MKSTMPFLGVRVPDVRRLTTAAVARYPFESGGEQRATVLELWRNAEFREERYAAIDLTLGKLVAADLQMLPVYEEIIRQGPGGTSPTVWLAGSAPCYRHTVPRCPR